MSNGLATRARLKKALHPEIHGDVVDIPQPPVPPGARTLIDPHDVEARKWFRRTMIALCIVGFAIIFMPDAMRQKLNAWFGTPTAAQQHADGINTRLCVNDWHERCLVCTYLDGAGQRVQSTHC